MKYRILLVLLLCCSWGYVFPATFSVKYNNRLRLLVSTQDDDSLQAQIQPFDTGIYFESHVNVGLIINELGSNEQWDDVIDPHENIPIVESLSLGSNSLSYEDILYIRSLNWRALAELMFDQFRLLFEIVPGWVFRSDPSPHSGNIRHSIPETFGH